MQWWESAHRAVLGDQRLAAESVRSGAMRGANGQIANASAACDASRDELLCQDAWKHVAVDDAHPLVAMCDGASEGKDLQWLVVATKSVRHSMIRALRQR